MVAASNAVNLTDGLDGLATVPSIMAFYFINFGYMYWTCCIFLHIYYLPNIKTVGELVILGTAMIGALIAFLWFNSHPAEVLWETQVLYH